MHRRSVLAGGLLTLLLAAPVLASHVQPEVVDGAEPCGPLEPGTVELLVAVPQDVGTITEDDFSVDVTLEGSVGNGSISFSNATAPISAALVAGAEGGNLYRYEEPVTADDGLVAPDGGPIIDVSFCYVSEAAAPTSDAAGDGGSATPEITTPATDAIDPAARNPMGLVLIAFGAISLLGAVALVLVPRVARPRR
jgi:hypothetical protein